MSSYRKIQRPEISEYPIYSQYYDLVKTTDDVLNELHANFFKIKDFIYSIPEDKLLFRYDVCKWTIREILAHLIDDQRIFSYRAFGYARNDSTPLNGFEENDYARIPVQMIVASIIFLKNMRALGYRQYYYFKTCLKTHL